MGKGDKKSKRGKIISGSYGVRRPKKGGKAPVAIAKPEKVKETPAKKTVTEEIKPESPWLFQIMIHGPIELTDSNVDLSLPLLACLCY